MGSKPKITISEFKEIAVRSIYKYIMNEEPYVPMLLEGASGLGKSAIMEQIVKELTKLTGKEWGLYTFMAGQRNATDILGIPFASENRKSLEWLKEKDMPGIDNNYSKEYGLFFLDELTVQTDESLRNALLQLTIERKFLGYELPKGWVVICAGNRQIDGNSYEKLSFPQRNRLECYELEFNRSDLIKWQTENGVHKAVTSFIKKSINDNEFLTYDPKKEEFGGEDGSDIDETNYVNATPRSWTYVSNVLNSYEKDKYNTNLLLLKIQSLIGSELGIKFMKYFLSFEDTINELSITDLRNLTDREVIKKLKFNIETIEDIRKYFYDKISNNEELDKYDLNILEALILSESTPDMVKKSIIMSLPSTKINSIRNMCILNDKTDLMKYMIEVSNTMENGNFNDSDLSWG